MLIAPPVEAASCCRRPSALRRYPRTGRKTLLQRITVVTLRLGSSWPGNASLTGPNRVFRHRTLTPFDSLIRTDARPRGVFGCRAATVRLGRDQIEKQLGVCVAMPDAGPPLITTERIDPQRLPKHGAQPSNRFPEIAKLLNSTSTGPPSPSSSLALNSDRATDPTASAPSPLASEHPSYPWTLPWYRLTVDAAHRQLMRHAVREDYYLRTVCARSTYEPVTLATDHRSRRSAGHALAERPADTGVRGTDSPCLAATANHCIAHREPLWQEGVNICRTAGSSPVAVLAAAHAEARCGFAMGTLLPEGAELTPGPVRSVYGYLV